MTDLVYDFIWNDVEAKKLSEYYKSKWAERANKVIRDRIEIDIPTNNQVAKLQINLQAEKGKSFAQFIEPRIPNPWDFEKQYTYAYTINNQNWFQLLPLTPWVWLSQPLSKESWLIPYGLNSELIQMLNEQQLDLSKLKVIRWAK